MMRLTIVKLGGSHAFSVHLGSWIQAIESLAEYVVIVPGGGPFADAVREAQRRMGFSDDAAHAMAMMAMAQYGTALADGSDKLVAASSMAGIRGALRAGRVPVWSPIPMALRDSTIAKSWRVTSDSLALWLAEKLNAHRLVLVKQRLPREMTASADELSEDGLVDAAFPIMYRERDGGNWIAGPEGYRSIGSDPPRGMARLTAAGGK